MIIYLIWSLTLCFVFFFFKEKTQHTLTRTGSLYKKQNLTWPLIDFSLRPSPWDRAAGLGSLHPLSWLLAHPIPCSPGARLHGTAPDLDPRNWAGSGPASDWGWHLLFAAVGLCSGARAFLTCQKRSCCSLVPHFCWMEEGTLSWRVIYLLYFPGIWTLNKISLTVLKYLWSCFTSAPLVYFSIQLCQQIYTLNVPITGPTHNSNE